MIAVDTNILVYAHREESDFHEAAYETLRALAEGIQAWTIPWPCVHEFYGIVSNPRIFNPPDTSTQAMAQLDVWRASPSVRFISTTEQHWHVLRDLCLRGKVAGGAIHDARIAAICIENGVRELLTADRDFSRFKGLKTRNPLV
jgi:uncharacterized protein